jgi:lipid A 3-O-deacylase
MPNAGFSKIPFAGCWLLPWMLLGATQAAAEDAGRITLTEENDSIVFPTDRYYTQGIELTYLGPDVAAESVWVRPFDALSAFGIFDGGEEQSRRYRLHFGQSIFTPADTGADNPDPDDRPYAGWTYGGVSLVQDKDRRRLENLELLVGIVGPAAQGRPTQNDWHQFIGVETAEGWDYQLHNEPGVMLTYERKYRFLAALPGGIAVDAIPGAGVTLGNVMTYGQLGSVFRFGRNLEADFGPSRIRPALSGAGYFNADYLEDPFGFYVYAGVQGRVVARNIFLDGNTWRDSREVDKEDLVGDLTGGIALFWSDAVKLDAGFTYRPPEFDGQDDAAKFANVNLTIGF